MIAAQALFDSAELSLASYTSLVSAETRLQVERLQEEGRGMSFTQATAFASRYPTVVAQFNDILAEGGIGTSFSATLFKDASGNLTVAMRGTAEILGDLVRTDTNIAVQGAAYDQIVAMVNWWRRATAPTTQLVPQFSLTAYTSIGGVDLLPASHTNLK